MILAIGTMALSGCGTRPEDRAISGAGIGGAGGAIIGAIAGVALLPATVIGAAVGGLTGGVTSPDLFDLGEPPWRLHGAAPGGRPASAASATSPSARTTHAQQAAGGPAVAATQNDVRVIQRNLGALGYRPGPADGVAGQRTRAAIRTYQAAHHLPVDGDPTTALARNIDSEIDRLRQLTQANDETAGR